MSSIYQATKRFLQKTDGEAVSATEEQLTIDFWEIVAKNIPDWQDALNRKVAPSELRSDYVHAHGIALHALAIAGNSLIKQYPDNWKRRLAKIKKINWSRANATLWEGRALVGGSLNKSQKNIILTANVIKQVLGLSLDPNEEIVERNYVKGQEQS